MRQHLPEHLLAEIRTRTSLAELVGKTIKLSKASKSSPELVGLCPFHLERTPSFSVHEAKAVYFCRGCGAKGNAFDFVMRTTGMSFPDVARRLAADAGISIDVGQHREQRTKPDWSPLPRADLPNFAASHRTTFIKQLWQTTWKEALPARRSPIENWIRARRIPLDPMELDALPLRWSPVCPIGKATAPAMVALMTHAITNEPTGIHRTFLLPDGSAKANIEKPRMMLGNMGVIRLSPDDEVMEGLGICEGIETGLAIMAMGWRPIWSAGSLVALRVFPVLPVVAALTVFADSKPQEVAGARDCAKRWQEAGREATVRIPVTGDWNDALVAK